MFGANHFAAAERDRNCVADYQRQGYERAPEETTPTPQPPSTVASTQPGLNGTYSGEITGQAKGEAFTMHVNFTLVHSGDQLVGVWNTNAGTSGTFQGVVSANQVSDFRVKQMNPCEGTFTGAAVVEPGRLRGSYTGTDCGGSVSATFVVNRQ